MTHAFEFEPEFWREGAACVGKVDADFFPAPDDTRSITRAKALCAGCPVREDCLIFALETNQPDGIWGGYTAKERTKIRRRWLAEFRRAS